MARKKKHEEHENHERWLVSYADFITLLFAFFVVMYSVSSVNEGKYRVLSESLQSAFRDPTRSLSPIQLGEPSKTQYSPYEMHQRVPVDIQLPGMPMPNRRSVSDVGKQTAKQSSGGKTAGEALEQMSKELKNAMSSLIDQGLIKVTGNELQVEVEINTEILFESGSATLARTAVPILEALAGVLVPFANDVLVEGYTDNRPIKSGKYPSNWELSASRSASVVHLFSGAGIDPERMAAIGYGEFRSIADNETAEGRSKNRRVVLVIPAVKPGSETHKILSDAALQGMSRFQQTKEWSPRPDVSTGRDVSLNPFELAPQAEIFARDRSMIADFYGGIEAPFESEDAPEQGVAVKSNLYKAGKFPVMVPPVHLPSLPFIGGTMDAGTTAAPSVMPELQGGRSTPILSPILPPIQLKPLNSGGENLRPRGVRQPVDGNAAAAGSVRSKRGSAADQPLLKPDLTITRDLNLSREASVPAAAASDRNKPSPAAAPSVAQERVNSSRRNGQQKFNIISPPVSLPFVRQPGQQVPGTSNGPEVSQ